MSTYAASASEEGVDNGHHCQMAPFRIKFQMADRSSLKHPKGGVADNVTKRTVSYDLNWMIRAI